MREIPDEMRADFAARGYDFDGMRLKGLFWEAMPEYVECVRTRPGEENVPEEARGKIHAAMKDEFFRLNGKRFPKAGARLTGTRKEKGRVRADRSGPFPAFPAPSRHDRPGRRRAPTTDARDARTRARPDATAGRKAARDRRRGRRCEARGPAYWERDLIFDFRRNESGTFPDPRT